MQRKNIYSQITEEIRTLSGTCEELISVYANVAAILYQSLDKVNWAGFYFYRNGKLFLGAFQGKAACTSIAPGKGVCGTAYNKKKTIIVKNVEQCPNHIVCDAESRSEIVVPLIFKQRIYGVLDIDSPQIAGFDEYDALQLETIVAILMKKHVNTATGDSERRVFLLDK